MIDIGSALRIFFKYSQEQVGLEIWTDDKWLDLIQH
jgi:hypothetical protein